MDTSSAFQFSPEALSTDNELFRVLGAQGQVTGILSVSAPQLHCQLALHQGTLRTALVNGEQLFQRLQVVKTLQALLLLALPASAVQFQACPLEALPGEAVPMNIQSLLLSVQTSLYQQQERPPEQAQMQSQGQVQGPQPAAEPARAAPQMPTGRIPLPAPTTAFVRSQLDSSVLGSEAYALWQQLEGVLTAHRVITAQQLAEQMNIGVGQARVKLYRLVLLGLLVPTA